MNEEKPPGNIDDADDEDDIEPLRKVKSECIEDQLRRTIDLDDKDDLKMWYASCLDMVSQALGIVEEIQDVSDRMEKIENESEQVILDDRYDGDITVCDIDQMEQTTSGARCYIALGEDYDGNNDDQDFLMDYDLVADKILKKKRIEGTVMYQVQWRGGGKEDEPLITWCTAEDLECPNLVLKFEASQRKKAKEKDKEKDGNAPMKPKSGRRKQPWDDLTVIPDPPKELKRKPLPVLLPSASAPVAPAPAYARPSTHGGVIHVDGALAEPTPPLFTRSKVTLYHGTAPHYADAIVKEGFRMPVARSGHGLGPVRPHMFGKGIYLTSSLEKASHFGSTILVCEVHCGRLKEVNDADYTLEYDKLKKQGFDAVYAKPGCGGNVFDEYVVYHPGQVRVVGFIHR